MVVGPYPVSQDEAKQEKREEIMAWELDRFLLGLLLG